MGGPVYEELKLNYFDKYPILNVERITDANRRLLAGNAMHVGCVGALLQFLIARVRRVTPVVEQTAVVDDTKVEV